MIYEDKRWHKFDFDAKKICVIIYGMEDSDIAKSIDSLKNIIIPDGFSLEITPIKQHDSLGCIFNRIIKDNTAKFKMYLQAGVLVLKPEFLVEALDLFTNEYKAGIVGLTGAEYIPVTANTFATAKRYGMIQDAAANQLIEWKKSDTAAKPVAAIDTPIIMTQYDILWQENYKSPYYMLLAQCVEFKRNGYEAMVFKQDEAWADIEGFVDFIENLDITEVGKYKEQYYKDVFPLVSILIPTHNRPEYLQIALESAVNQTYKNLEILISDDSDDERTFCVVDSYLKTDKRIKYYYHKGISATSNANMLIDNFRGEYISWLMDDDVYDISKIEEMIDYYREYDNVTLVTSKRQMIDANGEVINDSFLVLNGITDEFSYIEGDSAAILLLKKKVNFIGEPTTPLLRAKDIEPIDKLIMCDSKYQRIFKRKILQWDIGTKKLYGMVDIMAWFSLFAKGDIIYINKALSSFRYHGENAQKELVDMCEASTMISFYLVLHYAYFNKIFINSDKDFWLIHNIYRGYMNVLKQNIDIKKMSLRWVDFSEQFKKTIELMEEEYKTKSIIDVFSRYEF